jgi:hypothetical protein
LDSLEELRELAYSLGFPWDDTVDDVEEARAAILRYAT